MNHESEHQPNPEQHRPRHARLGDEFVSELVEHAPNLKAADRLRELFAANGTPFAFYLGLDDVDPYSMSLAEDFKNAYGGYYETYERLVENTLDALGLQDEFDEAITKHEELAGLITWDRDALRDLIRDRFDIVDFGGGLYVFER